MFLEICYNSTTNAISRLHLCTVDLQKVKCIEFRNHSAHILRCFCENFGSLLGGHHLARSLGELLKTQRAIWQFRDALYTTGLVPSHANISDRILDFKLFTARLRAAIVE